MEITIVAKAIKGREYRYDPRSAHKVSASGADYFVKVLNDLSFRLKGNEVWRKYIITEYDSAYAYANEQSFVRRKGNVYENDTY